MREYANRFPIPTTCRYCGGIVRLSSLNKLYKYGSKDEIIYLCQNCNAYVGTYPGTLQPRGRLANIVLRLKRQETHRVFDGYWRRKNWSRSRAYRWLAEQLKIPENDAHIGNFEMDDCEKVIRLCWENKKNAA